MGALSERKAMEINTNTPVVNHSTADNAKDVREWTHVEVAEWAKTVDDGQFKDKAQAFIDNEIDGKVLCEITAKQLETGLYFKNMMKRLAFYDLIQTLKQNDNKTTNQSTAMQSVTDLQRAPRVKKRKKRKQ